MNVDQATTPGASEAVDEADDLDLGLAEAGPEDDAELGEGEGGEGLDPETPDTPAETASDAEAEDLEDVEVDGQTFKIPAALKPAILRRDDYTRKTQELAESRRAFEADRQSHSEAQDAIVEKRAKLIFVDAQLADIAKMDLGAMMEEDPRRYAAVQQHREALKDAKVELTGEIETARKTAEEDRTKRDADQRQKDAEEHAAALRASHAELAKTIPNWSLQTAQTLTAFAGKEFGVTPQELAALETDPRFIRLLHAAYTGAEAKKKQTATTKVEAAQVTKPAATVKGSAPARKDPSRMTTEEWMAHRNRQVAKAAG